MTETLQSLGEAELLRRLALYAPVGQLDDDTATLPSQNGPQLINTDLLVEGVHFSDATTSPHDVGWRAAAMNLSDLAASGVDQVVGLTVGLVAPGDTPWAWVQGVYEGLSAALGEHGGILLGGDCSGGNQRMLAITAIGTLGPLRLLRSQARPGDQLVVSGSHGLSRLGLALLQNETGLEPLLLAEELRSTAIRSHQRPKPRLDALRTLTACKPEQLPWRAGGTDSSDGLLQALTLMSQASHCRFKLNPDKLPRPKHWPRTIPLDDWCLNGGEDFELVLSLPSCWAEAWLQEQPGSRWIGEVVAGPASVVWADSGKAINANGGFAHFDR